MVCTASPPQAAPSSQSFWGCSLWLLSALQPGAASLGGIQPPKGQGSSRQALAPQIQPKVRGQPRQRSDLLLDRRRQLGKLARPGHAGIPPAPQHICFFLKVLAGLIKDITSPPKLCHP